MSDGRVRRSEVTRAHVLQVAHQVFAESGYQAASVREIAGRAGLSHPGLLYHFPSKADLLMAVLGRRDEDICAHPECEGVAFPDLPPLQMLDHLVHTAELNQGLRGIVELFAQLSAEASSPDHPAREFFEHRYQWLRADLARGMARLDSEGGLKGGISPESVATIVIAVMDGLQVQWLLDQGVDMPARLADTINALVERRGARR